MQQKPETSSEMGLMAGFPPKPGTLVIAKFSSYPTPTPAGNEFHSAFAAFPALARFLAK